MGSATTDVEVTRLTAPAVSLPHRPGGTVPADDELLEQALAFSGSYVSDDQNVTITRSPLHASAYSGDRFVGRCAVCAPALLVPADGEPLTDVREAVRFISTHDHGGLD